MGRLGVEISCLRITSLHFIASVFFNYWTSKNSHYCCSKYVDLQTELTSNTLYKLSANDYDLLQRHAADWLRSAYGSTLKVKRLYMFSGMNHKKLCVGDRMTMEHLLALMSYCNYPSLRQAFALGCAKQRKAEEVEAVRGRNEEIANWCWLLMEAVFLFGDALTEKNKLFHAVDCLLSMHRLDFQFDLPLSMTTSLPVLLKTKRFASDTNCVCLQLQTQLREQCVFDLSHISSFPAECERLVFGAKLACTDLIFDDRSHAAYVAALALHQRTISGHFFGDDEGDDGMLHDKYQRRVLKLAKHMMANMKRSRPKLDYIPFLFASITKNASFGRRVIWLNETECTKLLDSLRQLMFQDFVRHTATAFGMTTRVCRVLTFAVKVEALAFSSRKHTICSSEYRQKLKGQAAAHEDIVLHCRCFTQFSDVKSDEMFNLYFDIKSASKSVSTLKIYGGLSMPQIAFEQWKYAHLSARKPNAGGALFSVKRIKHLKNLEIKVCFQVWSACGAHGHALALQ